MKRARGFSLIELVIVVGIIGVLAAVAAPIYRDYSKQADRAAAGAVLMEVVSKQEQYAATNRAYAEGLHNAALTTLGISLPNDVGSKYEFNVYLAATDSVTNAFRAEAVPLAGGAMDGDITLQVNQFGVKTPAGRW